MRGASESPKGGTGFEGEVAGLGLADIIQLNSLNRFSGCVSVQYEENDGLLFFRDGQIIHAEAGENTGEVAFYEIMRWPGGKFNLQPNVTTTVRSIERSWEFLLMEACRLIDEGQPSGATPTTTTGKKPKRVTAKHKSSRRRLLPVAISGAVLLLLAAAGGVYYRLEIAPRDLRAVETTAAAAATPRPSVAAGQSLLRLSGSTALSAQLAPALAAAYLTSLRANDVRVSAAQGGDVMVHGVYEGDERSIVISASDPTTSFGRLLANEADLAISARRITDEESKRLAGLGSMTSQANEHVLALDGLAVIVNRANPITSLKREQLTSIFSGVISDWSMLGVATDVQAEWSAVGVGGAKGGTLASGLQVFAPSDKLGLTEVFRGMVLGQKSISRVAKRFDTPQEVADAVAANPGGIGFVPLPFVLGTKAVPIASAGDMALMPTVFTIATEEYLLTHRLYLYTPQASANPHVSRFVRFALASEGQAVVRKAGFVELAIKAEARAAPLGAPPEYVKLTARAKRLSSTFRFEANSSTFDNRAARDLDRVVDYLRDNDISGASVKVLGFTDSQGSKANNLRLSRERAALVAQALSQRGISGATVAGLGAALPLSENSTELGRQHNRRVEIWVPR